MLKKLFAKREPNEPEPGDGQAVGEARPARKLREDEGLTITRLGLLVVLAVPLVLAGVAFVAYEQLLEHRAGIRQQAIMAQGGHLAAAMVARVQALQESLEAAATSSALREALLAADPLVLKKREAVMASAVPGALRVRFLPRGATEPDESTSPRLGYAALDLARTAEQGGRPPIEVHLYGSPDQHIALAHAIKSPNQPALGVMWTAIDTKVLSRWLAPAVPQGGYAELRQGAGGTFVLLASQGDMALQGTGPTSSITLPGTAWELVYWLPAGSDALGAEAQLDFFAVFAAGGCILVVVFMVFAWSVQRLLRGDLIMLVRYILDLSNRRRDHGYTVRLRESRKAVQAIDQYFLPAAPGGTEPVPESVAPVAPPVAVVIPEDPLFIPNDSIAVEELSEVPDGHKE